MFDPNFMSWHTYRNDARKGRPLTSTYRQDFRLEDPSIQLLTQRPKTSFDGVPSTMYRTVHGADSPNREIINAMNNEALMITAVHRQQQAKLKKSERRETVASCLTWHRPRVPESTPHTCYNSIDMRPAQRLDMVPHPPSQPHPAKVTECAAAPSSALPQPCVSSPPQMPSSGSPPQPSSSQAAPLPASAD